MSLVVCNFLEVNSIINDRSCTLQLCVGSVTKSKEHVDVLVISA